MLNLLTKYKQTNKQKIIPNNNKKPNLKNLQNWMSLCPKKPYSSRCCQNIRNAELPASSDEEFRYHEYPDKKPSLHGVSWLKIDILGSEVSSFMEDSRHFQIAKEIGFLARNFILGICLVSVRRFKKINTFLQNLTILSSFFFWHFLIEKQGDRKSGGGGESSF